MLSAGPFSDDSKHNSHSTSKKPCCLSYQLPILSSITKPNQLTSSITYTMSYIPEADYHKQRRSLLRKKTRAGWGMSISSVMTPGLPYMAGAVAVAAYSYYQSDETLEDLEQMMAERGIKTRSRDKLASFMVGTVEKAALTVAFLGHSEAACLDGVFSTDLACFRADEIMQHSVSGDANKMFNAPLDYVQEEVGYRPFESNGVASTMTVGASAAAVEYASGRVGDAASDVRNKYETGESQEAALRRMGVSRR
jgi:hypothetical protein